LKTILGRLNDVHIAHHAGTVIVQPRLITNCENIFNMMGDWNIAASHLCELMQSPKQDVSPSAVNDEEGSYCSGDSFSLYEWW